MLRLSANGLRRLSVSVLESKSRNIQASWLSARQCTRLPTTKRFLATQQQQLPTQRISVKSTPSETYLEEEEIDASILPSSFVSISLTDRAAEHLHAISERENNPDAALRLAVDSGGCHGYQYRMELARKTSPDDYYLAHPSVKGANIVIDAVSLPLINGASIDYSTELIGSAFKILENPNAAGAGCGCGVSWELKV